MQYLKVLNKWRRFLYVNTLVLLVGGLVIAFIVKPRYDSTAVVFPIVEQGTFAQFGTMQIPLSILMGGSSATASSQLFVEILNSRNLRMNVIKKLGLVDFFDASDIEDALKKLKSSVKVSSEISGVVTIKARTKDPEMSAEIVNAMVSTLDSINKNSVMYRGKRVRIMLEKRLAELEEKMRIAEESLEAFQSRHKTLSLPDEWSAIMAEYAQLKEKELEDQIKLNILEEIASPEHPEVLKVKRDLAGIRKELNKFERTGQSGFGPGFSIPLEKMPGVNMELARRMRDVEVYSEVYAYVIQQLEQARIMEKKDTPTLQIIDFGAPAARKSWPRKSFVLIASLLIGIVFGFAFAVILEYREEVERNPKYKNLKSLLDAISRDLHLK